MKKSSRAAAAIALALGCAAAEAGTAAAQAPATPGVPAASCLRPGAIRLAPALSSPLPPAPATVVHLAISCPAAESGLAGRLRSVLATQEPPYYLDGVRITAAELGALAPGRIQHVQLLKGSPLLGAYGLADPGAAVLVTTRPEPPQPDGAPR